MLSPGIVSILPETPPHPILVLGTLWAQVFVLILLCSQIRWHLYTWKERKRFDEWIGKHRKEIFVMNGLSVYPFLYCFEGIAATSERQQSTLATIAWIHVLHHICCIPFAILLWDLGRIYERQSSALVLINLHHVGVFLALPFHITENPVVASRTTRVFGWIWLVHIFPWLIESPLQLLIAKGIDAATVEAVYFRTKQLYCLATVFLVHGYFCGEAQPGFGWNYQTLSLVTLWIGRFGHNQNYRRSKMFRHIEFPGSIMVVLSSVFFEGNVYHGAAATTCIYVSILLGKSVFQEYRPGKWDPAHPKIEKVLNEFGREMSDTDGDANIGRSLETDELLYLWKENQSRLEEKYPLARAIIENNPQSLDAMIEKGVDDSIESIYEPMRELKNQTPAELAASQGRIRCLLLLITKAGLDPWEGGHCGGNSVWVLAKRFELRPLLELKDKLEPLAAEAYPPVSSSIFDRAAKVLRNF